MASFHPASDTSVLGPASPSVPALLKSDIEPAEFLDGECD
jgi:hypothetical protein